MAENIAPIEVKFKVDTTGLRKAETAVEKSGGKLKGKFGKIGKTAGIALAAGITAAAIGAARALSGYFSAAIDEASNFDEALSKNAAVFGDEAVPALEEWAAGAAEAFGQSETQALSAAGTFGNLLTAFGLNAGEAQTMSTNITELASDLASFNDTPVDEALLALRSGLSGETEPLKRFGIALTDARLKEEALRMGLIENTKGTLPIAIKSQAAYNLILKDSANAQGDYQRTSDGLANTQKGLEAQLANLRKEVGTELLPIQLELTQAFMDALPTIKDNLLPAIKDMAGTVKDNLVPALVDMLPKVIGFVTVIAANIDKIAALVGIVGALATTIKTYTAIQIALNLAMNSNPIGIIITAIAILIPILVLLFGDMEKLKEGFESFIETGEKVAGAIMQGIGMAFQFVADFFASIPDKLASFGETLYNFGKDVWGNFVQGALDILFFLPGKVAEILGSIPGLEGLADGITSGITASREAVTGMTGTQGTVAKRVADKAGTTVNNYNVEARGLTVDQVQQDAKRRGNLMSPVLGGA